MGVLNTTLVNNNTWTEYQTGKQYNGWRAVQN